MSPVPERGKEQRQAPEQGTTPPPGEGESLEDAARDAAQEIERREGGAGSGDIG